MIKKAVAFARKAHEGAFRKGTKLPYIIHPLETAVIVSLMTEDEEMIAAALLHDVVEDAGVKESELIREFGSRVADLVMAESEDKSKSWFERKSTTITHLSGASRELKMLTLADKLSNIRSTARDYLLLGDCFWDRFNEKDPEKQGWYYLGVAKALEELQGYPEYQEYVSLCNLVFKAWT